MLYYLTVLVLSNTNIHLGVEDKQWISTNTSHFHFGEWLLII